MYFVINKLGNGESNNELRIRIALASNTFWKHNELLKYTLSMSLQKMMHIFS